MIHNMSLEELSVPPAPQEIAGAIELCGYTTWPITLTGVVRRMAFSLDVANGEVEKLREGIRRHRDSWLRGDDKCWKDNEELYKLLPERYSPPSRDTLVELSNCEKYIASCHDPRVEYVSPQRRIEKLEAEVRQLRGLLSQIFRLVDSDSDGSEVSELKAEIRQIVYCAEDEPD